VLQNVIKILSFPSPEQIGTNSKAMLTIVGLIKESTPIGKRDDDTALGVAVYNPKSIVKAILVKTKCLTHEIKHYGI